MSISRNVVAGALAALALTVTTAGAFAAPAYATSHLNVRSGPGTHYRVVDTLQRGERVDVEYCRGSWCFINKSGRDGWASASYLERGQSGRWERPAPRPRWDRYDRYDRWDRHERWDHRQPRRRGGAQVCIDGRNSYFCFGS